MRMRTGKTMRTKDKDTDLSDRVNESWSRGVRRSIHLLYIVEPSGSRLPNELTCCEGKGNSGERAENVRKQNHLLQGS